MANLSTYVLDDAIMDFIDDAVLQVITHGSDETYPSYKEYMKSKIALIKEDPTKLNDIRNIIPFFKSAPTGTSMANKCKQSLKDNNVDDFILFYTKIKEITEKAIDMGIDVFDDKEQMEHVHKFINDVLLTCMNSCKSPPKCTKNYLHLMVGKGNASKSLYKEMLKLQCKCPNCTGYAIDDDGPPPLVEVEANNEDDDIPDLVAFDDNTKNLLSSVKSSSKSGAYALLQQMMHQPQSENKKKVTKSLKERLNGKEGVIKIHSVGIKDDILNDLLTNVKELETTVTKYDQETNELATLINSYKDSLNKMNQMKKEKLKQKDSKSDNNCDQINITI